MIVPLNPAPDLAGKQQSRERHAVAPLLGCHRSDSGSKGRQQHKMAAAVSWMF